MDKFASSPYLQKLYSINPVSYSEPTDDEEPTLTPHQCDTLKTNALNGVCQKMVLKSIPCDKECDYELEDDVKKAVDRYFNTHSGKIIQYFADTHNTVTDAITEAIDKAMTDTEPMDDEDEGFITAVVDNVTNNDDVDTVIKTIENEIKKSAEADIKAIIDDVKDDESESDPNDITPDQPDPTNINESIFHHYLIKQYKESAVPEDPETMLVIPMIETALHYVAHVLFSDNTRR